jgi:hypothetical protein
MGSYRPGFEAWQDMTFGYIADPDSIHQQRDFAIDGQLIKNTAEAYGLKAPRRGSVLRGRLDELVLSMTPPDRRIGGVALNRTTEMVRGEQ